MTLMNEVPDKSSAGPGREHDPGLRRLLPYTFISLVLAVLAAFLAMALVVHYFDR